MNAVIKSAPHAVLAKMRPTTLLLQWAGNLVLMACGVLWLQIPDSHTWQFVLSIFSAVGIVALALLLYRVTICRMRAASSSILWCLSLLAFVALWFYALHLFDTLRGKEWQWVGYWNSQMPASLRVFFSYERLGTWLDNIYDVLQWCVAGLLLIPAVEVVATGMHGATLRRVGRAYCHITYWIAVVVCGVFVQWITAKFAHWTPGHGLTGEWMSLIGRSGVAYTVDVLVWCFVLALAAYLLEASTSIETA